MAQKANAEFYGEKLRLARIFNGFTLAELGEKVSISRQYVQKLEVDHSTNPSDDLIEALSEVLNVFPPFFNTPVRKEVREERCHFRKRKTTPLHMKNKALACGTIFNSLISFFEAQLELPTYDIQEQNVSSRGDIERAAEKFRLHWQLHLDRPIHNVVRVIEKAGGVVTSFKDISDKIDAFSYIHNRPVVVRVPLKGSTSRTRFDLAHELGHIVLHQGADDDTDDKLEEQANQFASSFLLPRVSFLREFPKSVRISWERLIQFKKRWGVSLQAIIYRAYELGLLSATQYRSAHVYISRKGWRKNEPAEDCIDIEPSEIVPKCFNLLENQGINPSDIATALNLQLSLLSKFGVEFESKKNDNNDCAKYKNLIHLDVFR